MIRRRNLVCHILPRTRGQKWRATVDHLRRRLPLFNGKRIISVALDDDCNSLADVKAAFREDADSIDWMPLKNNPCLREVASFIPMLERVASLDPNEATFCCHGKGSTHGHDDSICHPWRDLMWIACCDVPRLVECALQKSAICGAFRTLDSTVGAPWHFRGSFYWVRHDALFSRDWKRINQDYVGTEAYPGIQFKWEESQCLFFDHPQSLYHEFFWAMGVFPAFQYWQAQLRAIGLSTTDYFPPKWFLERHPDFRRLTGLDGTATTPPEKRSWPRIPTFLRRAFSYSTK